LLEYRDGTLHTVPITVNHALQDTVIVLVPHFPARTEVSNGETTDLPLMTKRSGVHIREGGEEGIFYRMSHPGTCKHCVTSVTYCRWYEIRVTHI
jgi:hypothetical protein